MNVKVHLHAKGLAICDETIFFRYIKGYETGAHLRKY